jgi:hypothetical protein
VSDLIGEGSNSPVGHHAKGKLLQRSLTILLPARNVQVTLTSHVVQILEIAGELTDHLEILVLDNGSSDHTFEVAHDLAVRYPQVRVMRLNKPRSCQAAIASALSRTAGDVVFAYCSEEPACIRDLAAIRRLWAAQVEVAEPRGARETAATPDERWQTIDKRALPTSFFRADGCLPNDQPPRPNFLTTLREFALGE